MTHFTKDESKHMLFRMHKQTDSTKIQDVIDFIHGYLDLNNRKGYKLSFEEFKIDEDLAQPEGKMFDLFITTKTQALADVAHAAAWSYVTAKEGITSVEYVRAMAKNAGTDLSKKWDNTIINFALNYMGTNIEDAVLSGLNA